MFENSTRTLTTDLDLGRKASTKASSSEENTTLVKRLLSRIQELEESAKVREIINVHAVYT